jgi:Tol biopolymer transport system component
MVGAENRMKRRWAIVSVLGFLAIATPAHAAFPGTQGRIAFDSDRDGNGEIYTMNADGSAQSRITTNTSFDARPAWSADGKKIAWESQQDGTNAVWVMNGDGSGQTRLSPHAAMEPAWSPDGRVAMSMDGGIFVVNADGTGGLQLTSQSGTPDAMPAWSPGGDKIAFMRFTGSYDVWVMNADGTNQVNLTPGTAGSGDYQPNWAPWGDRIAFASDRSGNADIYTMKADGSVVAPLTTDPGLDQQPAWDPTGSAITFESNRATGKSQVYRMGADGTAQTRLTNDSAFDSSPDWQPVPFTGYARPKGATPIRLPLVPAYNSCAVPTSSHGAPLAFPSCKPPVPGSTYLTVGTFDANGAQASSLGFFYFNVQVGVPGPPIDSSFNAGVTITDVRCSATSSACGSANDAAGPDYIGELRPAVTLRITDKKNGPSLNEPATMTDYTLSWSVSCGATSSTSVGSTCSFPVTCMDAVVPGLTPEGTRDVWELVKAEVYDGGSDGDGDTTADNTLFARPGLFVP